MSLWDIVQRFHVEELAHHFRILHMFQNELEIAGELAQARGQAVSVQDEAREKIIGHIEDLKDYCSHFGLKDAAHRLSLIVIGLRGTRLGARNPLVVAKELDYVEYEVESELSSHVFWRIAKERGQYAEGERLFGKPVHKTFPSARQEIIDAGNCLAAELHTAAVFHLMRVSEHGLRYLAKRLRVKIKSHGHLCPIDYSEWGQATAALSAKLTEARKIPTGKKRITQLELYADASDHCVYMKDIWRNSAAHTRKPYKASEALGVYERVRDFMHFLASALGQ